MADLMYKMTRRRVWVGFTGTRQGVTQMQLIRIRQALLSLRLSVVKFVHGGAKGADREAHSIAEEVGVRIRIRPAIGFDTVWLFPEKKEKEDALRAYEILPEKPPLERNHDIVNDVNFMLACPARYLEEQRSGTWATIRFARKVHKPLAVIWPNGDQQLEMWPGDAVPW